jgi:anaerobic magnesium-protoporphyrin IX monomethyl ester cyclase
MPVDPMPAKSRKLLLLNPPLSEEERSGALAKATGRSLPYGLLSIASVVRLAGYSVEVMDAEHLGYSVEETCARILAADPAYLGITTVTLSIDRTAELARLIKAKNPAITIIAGGAHISSAADETMQRFPGFDVGVLGEGEITVVALLKALDAGADLQTVEGLIYRAGDAIRRTGHRPHIQDLDTLPFPAWDLLPGLARDYRPSAPSYVRLPATTIVTSRGCFGHCLFCNSRAIHGGLRCFGADYVLKMMRHLQSTYGIRDLSIYDDNFIYFKERIEKICRGIIDGKLDFTWSCYSRVDQGDLELFKLMKRAGCWQVSYGVESGSQAVLDFIRKDVTLDQIRRTITLTKKAGLRTRGFFMIGHLTDTPETVRETIRFMQKLPLDDFHFTTFTPLPGTTAYRIADQYGTFDKTWSKMNLQYPSFVPKALTAELMEKLSKLAYRQFYFRPKIILSYLLMLLRYPNNINRLFNGLQALVSRIFLKDHSDKKAYSKT